VIVRNEGEAYREGLIERCQQLGISGNVTFVNRYLSLRELVLYLQATDIYLMPYLNPEQIVSGTMAYALGAGKPTVATPFAYAREVLADGRGLIVPFRDTAAIAGALRTLAADDRTRLSMANRAYAYTRSWVWREVGKQYANLYRRVLSGSRAASMATALATA
jgi:glycosyltransferase involved in cell wall biosynthesis